MNVRLMGGPANGQLLVVEDHVKEVEVPSPVFTRAEVTWNLAPSPDDFPPAFVIHCYRPANPIGEPGEGIVPFYLYGGKV